MITPTPVASTIMIIRHAEKPLEPPASPPPFGVTPDGTPDDRSLSVRGWQRAGALASLFAPARPTPSSIKTPQFIYAVKVDGDDEKPRDAAGRKIGTKGKRSQQTVTPIAEKLRSTATLNFTYDKGDEVAMIASAMAAPETWPADAQGNGRFDVVWLFEFDTTAGTYRFSHIPQTLLAGDIPE